MRTIVLFFLSVICSFARAQEYDDVLYRLLHPNAPVLFGQNQYNLKGKPFSVATYNGDMVSSWGEVSLQKGSITDYKQFNEDGHLVKRLYGNATWCHYDSITYKNGKVADVYCFQRNWALEENFVSEMIKGHINIDSDFSLDIKLKYNWITSDSLRIELYKADSDDLESLYVYKFSPNSVTSEFYKNRHAAAEKMETVRDGNIMYVEGGFNRENISFRKFEIQEGGIKYPNLARGCNSFNLTFGDDGKIISITPAQAYKDKLLKESSPGFWKIYTDITYFYDNEWNKTKVKSIEYTTDTNPKKWIKDKQGIGENQFTLDNQGNWVLNKTIINENPDNTQYSIREIIYYDSPEYDALMAEIEKDKQERIARIEAKERAKREKEEQRRRQIEMQNEQIEKERKMEMWNKYLRHSLAENLMVAKHKNDVYELQLSPKNSAQHAMLNGVPSQRIYNVAPTSVEGNKYVFMFPNTGETAEYTFDGDTLTSVSLLYDKKHNHYDVPFYIILSKDRETALITNGSNKIIVNFRDMLESATIDTLILIKKFSAPR